MTDPIVESSTEIIFSRYNGAYPKLDEHFKAANLVPEENRWRRVFDFTPSTTDKRNWDLSDDFKPWTIEGSDGEKAINPVPFDSGKDIKDEEPKEGGMQSFSFTTTQAEAQKILDDVKKKQEKSGDSSTLPTPPPPSNTSSDSTTATTTTAATATTTTTTTTTPAVTTTLSETTATTTTAPTQVDTPPALPTTQTNAAKPVE